MQLVEVLRLRRSAAVLPTCFSNLVPRFCIPFLDTKRARFFSLQVTLLVLLILAYLSLLSRRATWFEPAACGKGRARYVLSRILPCCCGWRGVGRQWVVRTAPETI